MALSHRQKLTIVSLLFYWPTIFILAHIPIPQVVYRARVSDKSLHFLVYLILVFLLWFAINPDRRVNWRKAGVWWILLVVVWYGAFDEWLQGYVGRSCNVMDFLADLVGALTSLVLLSIFSFWSASVVVTGLSIFLFTNLARANLSELLPVTNAMFHLLAYGFFTMLWLRYVYHFLPLKAPQIKWLTAALALPIALVVVVKSASAILGKGFELRDAIISIVGIAAVVAANCVFVLSHRGFAKKSAPGVS